MRESLINKLKEQIEYLQSEREQTGGMSGFIMTIAIAGILLVLAAYVSKKLSSQINDTDVDSMTGDLVSGFKDNIPMLSLVLLVFFLGMIIQVLKNLQ